MIPVLRRGDPVDAFPDPSHALRDPDGLLAMGGDLSPARLMAAYRRGIFPWYGPGDPILWWSPDPRAVLRPGAVHCSRRLARSMRKSGFRASLNEDFVAVVEGCAAPRGTNAGTWLVAEMQSAYARLHRLGVAHSFELWDDTRLIGGLYGLALGRAFFAESMFSRAPDASKMLLIIMGEQLARRGFRLIDAQVASPHLLRMGAESWPRARFLEELAGALAEEPLEPLASLDEDLRRPAGAIGGCAAVEQVPAM